MSIPIMNHYQGSWYYKYKKCEHERIGGLLHSKYLGFGYFYLPSGNHRVFAENIARSFVELFVMLYYFTNISDLAPVHKKPSLACHTKFTYSDLKISVTGYFLTLACRTNLWYILNWCCRQYVKNGKGT